MRYTTNMQDSLFTKIINGELPSYKVYEDDKTVAVVDIYPIQLGQVVVVPKKQVSFVWDLDDEDYVALMRTVQRVGRKIRDVFPEKDRVGVMIEGLEVADHAHVKVFPFSAGGEYRALPSKAEPNHEELARLAEKLRLS